MNSGKIDVGVRNGRGLPVMAVRVAVCLVVFGAVCLAWHPTPASADDTIYVLCNLERRAEDSMGVPCFLLHDTSISYHTFIAKHKPGGDRIVVRISASDADIVKIRKDQHVSVFRTRNEAVEYCVANLGIKRKLLARF